jgi:hypothetical protein
MKATYAQLKAAWDHWQKGMNCPTDEIPPMFIYAWHCALECGRMEKEDERPRQTDHRGCPQPKQNHGPANGISSAIQAVFQADVEDPRPENIGEAEERGSWV